MKYYAHGKLLLTGEYLVLKGATSLAIPCRYGQYLEIEKNDETNSFFWKALDELNEVWFSAKFSLHDAKLLGASNEEMGRDLEKLFQIIIEEKGNEFFSKPISIITKLEFPRNWGLGTSSTLLHLLYQWTGVNPYTLLAKTWGGSGYDIACAGSESPILFSRHDDSYIVVPVMWNPVFHSNLFFIYLGRKQKSSTAVKDFLSREIDSTLLTTINKLTDRTLKCTDFDSFCQILHEHETLMSSCLEIATVQETLFSDFDGAIKSLGAWGGDFILAASKYDPTNYFLTLGYKTVIPYQQMILQGV